MDSSLDPEELQQLEELKEWQRLHLERLFRQHMLELQSITREHQTSYECLNPSTIDSGCKYSTENDDKLISSVSDGLKSLNMSSSSPRADISNHKVPTIHNVSIDDTPIKTTCSDFNSLLERKLKDSTLTDDRKPSNVKAVRTYLKKGEGMTRFGMTRDDIGCNSKKLPWLRDKSKRRLKRVKTDRVDSDKSSNKSKKKLNFNSKPTDCINLSETSNITNSPKTTWLNLLTEEQGQFLNEIKQSSFYKNYLHTPDKNCFSDSSLTASPSFKRNMLEKEIAEQKLFDLVEQKVENDSFCSTSSFCAKVTNLSNDIPGANVTSTNEHELLLKLNPLLLQNRFKDTFNPEQSSIKLHKTNENLKDDPNSAGNDVKDSSESSDTEETCRVVANEIQTSTPNIHNFELKNAAFNKNHGCSQIFNRNKVVKIVIDGDDPEKTPKLYIDNVTQSHLEDKTSLETNSIVKDDDSVDTAIKIDFFKSKFEELINAKNCLDIEREEFLKEKAVAESKLNEDRVIAEYYLAEEKEKLLKEKRLYDRHIKEMKNHDYRKKNDEIDKLNREVNDLKEQIAAKDAKTGAAHAKLRNQIKLLEKDKSNLKEENEKLIRQVRKLKNSNERSRRLTNIKNLADISKAISSNYTEIEDVYSSHNLSKESLSNSSMKKAAQKPVVLKHNLRKRTKSAPNITSSHYAKYFSKKDERQIDEQHVDEVGYGLDSEDDSDTSHKSNEIIKSNNNNEKQPNLSNLENVYTHKLTDFNEVPRKLNFNEIDPQVQSKKSKSPTLDRIETIRPDGSKEIKFSNGNCKIVSADESYLKFTYYNGDIKEVFYNDGITKYYYKEPDIHSTTYRDRSEVLQFPDGYIERRYPDGSVQSHLPDGPIRYVKPGTDEEWRFPDGTLISVNGAGDQTVRFSDGQVEIRTSEFKKREFPDGTVKIIYADGVAETRYANGRLRVKDKQGNLLMDSFNRNNDYGRRYAVSDNHRPSR